MLASRRETHFAVAFELTNVSSPKVSRVAPVSDSAESTSPIRVLTQCRHCKQENILTLEQLQALLYRAGLLRRIEKSDPTTILEVARGASQRIACESCKATGLMTQEATPEDRKRVEGSTSAAFDDDEDWGDPKPCSRCRQLIPAERVALFPHITLCVKCQQADDRGEDSAEADYCPQCGTPRTVRKSTGRGLARYETYCPHCRK